MNSLQTYDFGFDYRGPSSSEELNRIMDHIAQDLNNLSESNIKLRQETIALASQSLKQEIALLRKINELAASARDDGSICSADLSDPSVMLTTDINGDTIPAGERLLLNTGYGIIVPPCVTTNHVSRYEGSSRVAKDGVTVDVEVITENGTVTALNEIQAIAGLLSVAFERVSVTNTPQGANDIPEISLFCAIAPSPAGTGYPLSNYISFLTFPVYTEAIRVYYSTDYSPTLTRSGSTWVETPSYVTNLSHSNQYMLAQAPIFASFPEDYVSAVRIDIKQPFYIVDGATCVYSYGIGALEFGYKKPSASTCKGTITIEKPSGSWSGITDEDIVINNLALADWDEVVTLDSVMDDGDTARVEITMTPFGITSGQIPVITSVSVDYTT